MGVALDRLCSCLDMADSSRGAVVVWGQAGLDLSVLFALRVVLHTAESGGVCVAVGRGKSVSLMVINGVP
jgi:hypothetical protein